MYEQDVVSRMLRDAVRVVLKALFGRDFERDERPAPPPDAGLPAADAWTLAAAGRLDEAEEKLFAALPADDRQGLQTALLFYAYLNEFDDGFLLRGGWTRAGIRAGMLRAAERYGAAEFVAMLLPETPG